MYSFNLYPVTIKGKRYRLPCNMNSSRFVHWASKKLVDDAFINDAWIEITALHIPKCDKIKLSLEEHACHFADDDNIWSSMKKIKDLFVKMKIIKDDDYTHCQMGEIVHIKEMHRKDEYLKIKIEII